MTTTETLFNDPRLASLAPWQENMFWRISHLFLRNPDTSELSAEPSDLKRTLYPLKPDLRESQVQSALTALTLAGMIAVYPDDNGHPYLRLISADSLTINGGDYRGGGGGGGGGRSCESVSPSSKRNEGHEETITNPTNDTPSLVAHDHGNAVYLGLTSADVESTMNRYQKIEDAANHYGLNASYGCIQDALGLADTYTLEWLLKAMKMARDAKWKWKFVESQLARWKENGATDSPESPHESNGRRGDRSSIRRSKKTDAELDAELKKWGVSL